MSLSRVETGSKKMSLYLQDSAPWKIGKSITVTCDPGYLVSPPTPADATGFLAECVPGDPVWNYTSLDGSTVYASTPKCSNMKFCQVLLWTERWSEVVSTYT